MKRRSGTFSCRSWAQLLVIFGVALILQVQQADAANDSPQTFTLDGRLYKTGTLNPLVESSVKLKIQILNSAKTCILYEEQQTVSTLLTAGYFNIQVGSSTGSSKRTSDDPGSTMTQIFQNITPISGMSAPSQACGGNSYTPSAGDVRYFRISVTPSSTNLEDVLAPDMVLNSVPQAIVAQNLQGLEKSQILQVNTAGSTDLTQAHLEALFTTPAYSNLQSILAGNFLRSDSTGASLPSFSSNPTSPAAGDIWYDSVGNTIKYYNGTAVQTIGTGGSGISSLTVGSSLSADGTVGGSLTSSGTIDLSNTGVSAGTYQKVTVNIKGRVTAGASLDNSDIPTLTTAGKVSGTAIITGTISGDTSINTTGNLVSSGTVSGQTVQATQLRVYNGSNYVQFLAPSLSGNVLFTLPDNDGNAGEILKTNGSGVLSWVSPSSAVTSADISTALGYTPLSPSSNFSGDVTGTSSTTSVDKIKGKAVTAATATNQIMIYNGTSWVNSIVSGDATISSAGTLALDTTGVTAGTYTKVTVDAKGRVTTGANLVSGDITTALGFTPLSASSNLSGDVSGASNSNSVDKLKGKMISAGSASGQIMIYNGTSWDNSVVSGDATMTSAGIFSLNTVPIAKGGTAATSFTSNALVVANGTGSALTSLTCGLNQLVSFDASGVAGCYAATAVLGGTNFAQNGNSFSADATLGTNDNFNLNFETNGSSRMTIKTDGNVGIGTTSPGTSLDVSGAVTVRPNGTGAGNSGQILLRELATNGTNTVTLKAPDLLAADVSFTMPSGDGSNGQVLSTNGSGVWKWIDMSAGGSASTDVYSNGGNSFGVNATLGTKDTRPLAFMTNNATRMAISQDGSVGIGTNKPVSFVQIAYPGMISAINNANTYLQIGGDESTSNGHRLIGFGYTTPSNTYSPAYMGYQESSSAGQSKGDLIFGTRSTTSDAQPEERMRIMSSGNVGIGTNAPGTSLDVSGAITVRPTGTASGNTGQILLRELSVNGTNTVTLRAPDALAADVSFALPSGDGSSGQVLSTNGLGVLTWIDAGSSNGFVDGGNSFGQAGDLGTNDNNPLYLRTNSNTKMTILAAGNIGIGTTNPTYSLSFSGDSSRTIGMERHSTAGTAGSDLILAAGGATSGSSNKDGGGLQLKAGTATGNGGSNISFYVAQGNQGPGTTDRLADIFMGGIDGTTRSVRLGIGSSAAGNYSTALGYSASAQGNYSVAVGPNFYVSGTNSMGFNLDTTNRTLSQDSTMAIMGGNVGIGTTIPGSGTKLNVDGQIRSKSASIATGSVDWSAGNTVTTSFDCGSQISMANIRDGGSYTLVVTGTGTTQCDFNTATTGDDAGTVTYRFSPPNSTRSASTHTIYSLLRVGTIVYISWIGGF